LEHVYSARSPVEVEDENEKLKNMIDQCKSKTSSMNVGGKAYHEPKVTTPMNKFMGI
jgi:hypothetical protein